MAKQVHLIGICGSAMASLAGMLQTKGFRVTGSDAAAYPPMSDLLDSLGIPIAEPYAEDNVPPKTDLVIVGNAISRGNVELEYVLDQRIPFVSLAETIQHEFLRGRESLVVAGTHGKTTTTSMLAWIYEVASHAQPEVAPSFLIGGIAENFGASFRVRDSKPFILEGDEYDTAFFDKGPKFLHYGARGAIITAVEFDHADIYRDLDHVKSSFRALVGQMDSSRVLAVCADFPHALEVSAGARARRLTYVLREGEYRATEITVGADGARFSVTRDGDRIHESIHLPIGGRMNVANALGVYVLLSAFGVSGDEIAAGLRTFKGVVRRQQVIGDASGITVVDDFAHHPTAIGVTLEAIAERFPGRRILAAFEPRSNTARRNVFQDAFAAAFDKASRVYLGPVYFKENDQIAPTERLETAALANAISARGPDTTACASNDEILERMLADARAGDVALFMSNGPFDGLKERFLAALRAR